MWRVVLPLRYISDPDPELRVVPLEGMAASTIEPTPNTGGQRPVDKAKAERVAAVPTRVYWRAVVRTGGQVGSTRERDRVEWHLVACSAPGDERSHCTEGRHLIETIGHPDGHCFVDLMVQTTNQRDTVTTICEATCILPSREHGPVILPEPPHKEKVKATEMWKRHNELLREQGFFTAAVDNIGRWIQPAFDRYEEYPRWDHDGTQPWRNGEQVTERGNPQTGPFYVEGAEPGDALELHLDRLEPNRGFGYSGSVVAPGAVPSTHLTLPTNYSV